MMLRTTTSSPGLSLAVKAAALATVAACGFHPAGGLDDGDARAADATAVDAPVASDGRPPLDARPEPDAAGSALCDPTDANLVLCMPFDDGTATNLASGGPQPTTTTAVTAMPGRVGSAAGLSATSVLWFDEPPALELTSPFTIEMFVYYTQDPPTTGASGDRRIGVLDNDNQYSIFLGWRPPVGQTVDRVTPYCNVNSTAWGPPISKDAWHHVACVHSGATLTVYVDGVPGVPVGATTPVNTGGTNGTTLGQNCDPDVTTPSAPLVGGLDEVRVWNRVARTGPQIVAAAAR